MLRSGQLNYQRYIRTIEESHTDANGTFDFVSLPGDDVDLAYWADGVPQGNLAGIRRQPANQREHLNIRVPSAAMAKIIRSRIFLQAIMSCAYLENQFQTRTALSSFQKSEAQRYNSKRVNRANSI